MKRGLIVTRKKYLVGLLNNSKVIGNIKSDSIDFVNLIKLLPSNLKYIESLGKTNEELRSELHTHDYDFVIFDEMSLYDPALLRTNFYFIPPIEFNITDPYITERFQLPHNDSITTCIEWCNNNFNNLFFLTSTMIELENNIVDLGLILNLNNTSELWGKYHYSAKDLFLCSPRKPHRLDYTFREVKKENRVKFFLDLINTLNEKELFKIKLSCHGGFLTDSDLYSQTKSFFQSHNQLSLFLELEKIDKRFISFDELENHTPGYNAWVLNKVFNHTFSSDISVYFESGRDVPESRNTMNIMITEKTIDNITIGKPFIHMSPVVDIFLKTFGFKNYNVEVFDKIDTDKVSLVKKILSLNYIQYDGLYKQLEELRNHNLAVAKKYYSNNTFLYNLIHN
jgi:hypothetical protein